MIPTSSKLANKLVTAFYYNTTKRNLFGHQNQLQPNTTRTTNHQTHNQLHKRCRTTKAADCQSTDGCVVDNQYDAIPLANLYFTQFPNYCQMITDAKSRARRSILIDHCGIEYINLKDEFENVEQVYSIERETRRGLSKLSLIEFKGENDAENVAKQALHNDGFLPVPLKVFRYRGEATEPKSSEHLDEEDLPFPIHHVKLSYKRDLTPNTTSFVDLVTSNMMSLVALKLRFITLINFERVLCSGMFEEYELMPFGSSVIDTGCDGGDLDLVLTRKENHQHFIQESLARQNLNQDHSIKSSRGSSSRGQSNLIHLDKSLYNEIKDNSGIRGTMRWFDHILREYMPLTDGYGVQFVPHAKVPIIKFTSRVTFIDCDLSFNFGLDYRECRNDILSTNYSGIIMSQILYALCRGNNLFTATVIYLRLFAKVRGITAKGPHVGFTNFQLLSLIMFYLQQTTVRMNPNQHDQNDCSSQPIIPPFKELLNSKLANPTDDDQEVRVHFDNDQLNKVLPEVIKGFFKFYSEFDFTRNALNLYEAKVELKLDNSPVYVTNPMVRDRNICHNVHRKALSNFIERVRAASNEKCLLTMIEDLLKQQRESAKIGRQLTAYDIVDSM